MSDPWAAHLVTAAWVVSSPGGRGWRGDILGPAPGPTAEDAKHRPVVWYCEHRHRLARKAVECAELEAQRVLHPVTCEGYLP